MRKLALLLFLAAITLPALAAKRVTVEQLEQTLASAQGKPDAEVAQQLADLELTERLSATMFARLKAGLPGEQAQQALTILADEAEFLNLPAAEIPPTPPPSPGRAAPDDGAGCNLCDQDRSSIAEFLCDPGYEPF